MMSSRFAAGLKNDSSKFSLGFSFASMMSKPVQFSYEGGLRQALQRESSQNFQTILHLYLHKNEVCLQEQNKANLGSI